MFSHVKGLMINSHNLSENKNWIIMRKCHCQDKCTSQADVSHTHTQIYTEDTHTHTHTDTYRGDTHTHTHTHTHTDTYRGDTHTQRETERENPKPHSSLLQLCRAKSHFTKLNLWKKLPVHI